MLFSRAMTIGTLLSWLSMGQCQPNHKGKHGFWHKEKRISNSKKQQDATNDVIPAQRDSIQKSTKMQKVQKIQQRSGINTNPRMRYSAEQNVVKYFTPTKFDQLKSPPQYNTGKLNLETGVGKAAAAANPVVVQNMAQAEDTMSDTLPPNIPHRPATLYRSDNHILFPPPPDLQQPSLSRGGSSRSSYDNMKHNEPATSGTEPRRHPGEWLLSRIPPPPNYPPPPRKIPPPVPRRMVGHSLPLPIVPASLYQQ